MVSIESVTLVPDDQLLWVAEGRGHGLRVGRHIIEYVDEQKIERRASLPR